VWFKELLAAEQLRQFAHLDHFMEHRLTIRNGRLTRDKSTFRDLLTNDRQARAKLIEALAGTKLEKILKDRKNNVLRTPEQIIAELNWLRDNTKKNVTDLRQKILKRLKPLQK
jgi:hypothetical protein